METWLYNSLQKKKLSQAKLAEMIGIDKSTLNKKFCGKLPFLYREVADICEILEIENPLPYFPKKRK